METEIGWTVSRGADGALHGGFTFNAWSGCTKYSPGCANCYAAALPPSMRRGAAWGPEAERVVAPDSYWRHPFAWARRAARLGVRLKVFAQSVSDWCEEREELHGPRMRLLALACLTRNDLDWLLLTKRAAHMRAVFDLPDLVEQVIAASAYFVEIGAVQNPLTAAEVVEGLARLYLGVSVENQKAADERAPELIAVRADVAAVRFLSCEPLLGPVLLWTDEGTDPNVLTGPATVQDGGVCGATGEAWSTGQPGIDWVIIGGESGDRARPMHPDWARQLIAQCDAAGVPVFFKQWGAHVEVASAARAPDGGHVTVDPDWGADRWTPGISVGVTDRGEVVTKLKQMRLGVAYRHMHRMPAKAAGREIDGRTFDGFPNTSVR